MMDLATIASESRKAAGRAARAKKQPFIVEQDDLPWRHKSFPFPFIGNYTPRGWKKTENLYFVDSSGFGEPGEPALTVSQFAAKLRSGFGYAIIEVGQFQVYIQEYTPPKA